MAELGNSQGVTGSSIPETVAQTTDEALTKVGQHMTQLAGKLREKAPPEGPVGQAAHTVAQGLEAGGRYLEEHSVEDMTKDVATLVRRYPLQSILVGFGVGCLVGVALSKR